MTEVLDYLKANQEAYTVVGILLTLFISLISLWFTVKNNKAVQYVDSVTKNRVEWIDKLRFSISELLALLDTQNLTDTIIEVDDLAKYPFGDNLHKLNQLGAEIKLMLNFSDEFDRKMMQQIELIILSYKNLFVCIQSNILENKQNGDAIFIPNEKVLEKQQVIGTLSNDLLSDMQIYLKSEWNRVKYESNGKIYEKETQIFDIEELQKKKADSNYKNNTWKRFCINSKAKCKRIWHSHQFAIVVFVLACIVLIKCIPEIIDDLGNGGEIHMDAVIQWFSDNLYTNIFTILTVIVSGLISLLISKYYFKKSNDVNNRENLKISVIHPLIALLDSASYTVEKYNRLVALEKEYSMKYMPATERACLANLRAAYKDVAYYDEDAVNAKILFSYFERCLSEQGIKWDPKPVEINGEIVDYEPPDGYFELEDDIARVFGRFDYHIEPVECQDMLERIFNNHVRNYCSGKKASFFKDATLPKIIKQDERTAKNNEMFVKYQQLKTEFLAFPLIKNEIR